MENYKNYYTYADAIREQQNLSVYVPSITIDNVDDHINGIYAILKDGIETDYVHNLLVNVSWGNGINCDLFIIDYWYSLFMWKMILNDGDKIQPRHIFYTQELKRSDIKKYVDKFILTRDNKIKLGNVFLNNNICDGLWPFAYTESFSWYLANTINNEDNIALMEASPEFNALIHCSLAGVPIEQVKDTGLDYTYKAVDIIKKSESLIGYNHGLKASLQANEAINVRQFKEAVFNIGTKPNGTGGIYPHIIDKSFSNGGVNTPLSFLIEADSARTAQIMSKTNVGESGDFARILGLNNTDTIANPDMNYECMSNNFIKFEIKSPKHLSMIKDRYYRFNPKGMEYLIDDSNLDLVGNTIYLRSPMTCASHASGKGICKRCYGDLYYTNKDINIGKIASEMLSSQLTQRMLSAKHLLETIIKAIKWNPEFADFFDVDLNTIRLADIDGAKKYTLIIDPESVYLVNEEEDTITFDDDDYPESVQMDDDAGVYNEYITHFIIRTPDNQDIIFGSEDQDNLYISHELNTIIRRKATPDGGMVNISLAALQDVPLFYININNNEISKTMNDIMNVINKSSVTENMTKDEVMQAIVDLVVEGHLDVDAVHLEVILANQIVDPNDILRRPNWDIPEVQYKIFTLDHALTNNPSVIITLLYKDLNRTLYNPLTFTKHAPSFFDMFFMEQPQVYMKSDLLDEDPEVSEPDKGITMCRIVDKK